LSIASVAAILLALWPLWSNIQAAIALKNENANNLIERQQLTANLERLINQYNGRANDLASFNEAIPVGENIPELLVNLEAIASESGLILSSVDFKPADSDTSNIETLIMEIKLKGSYPAFKNYLRAMETSLRIFDVTAVSFTGVTPGQGNTDVNSLEFNLTVNTYYQ